jgi:hypothetical protein
MRSNATRTMADSGRLALGAERSACDLWMRHTHGSWERVIRWNGAQCVRPGHLLTQHHRVASATGTDGTPDRHHANNSLDREPLAKMGPGEPTARPVLHTVWIVSSRGRVKQDNEEDNPWFHR